LCALEISSRCRLPRIDREKRTGDATMSVTPPPRVETPSFTLRVWSVEDAPLLREALAVSDAHLRAWTPWVVDGRVPGASLESRLAKHAEAFAARTEWVYGMFSPDGTAVLGGCGLYPRVGPGAIEIGYWLSVLHTGRGLATEAAAVLTRLAFAAPAVERVEIRCDPRNVASARVPHRLGYRVETNAAAVPDEFAVDRATADLMIWRLSRAELAPSSGSVQRWLS
jgi:RimJ/RimL family protein N-acetyltransferase